LGGSDFQGLSGSVVTTRRGSIELKARIDSAVARCSSHSATPKRPANVLTNRQLDPVRPDSGAGKVELAAARVAAE
jgi:hypothetical protein